MNNENNDTAITGDGAKGKGPKVSRAIRSEDADPTQVLPGARVEKGVQREVVHASASLPKNQPKPRERPRPPPEARRYKPGASGAAAAPAPAAAAAPSGDKDSSDEDNYGTDNDDELDAAVTNPTKQWVYAKPKVRAEDVPRIIGTMLENTTAAELSQKYGGGSGGGKLTTEVAKKMIRTHKSGKGKKDLEDKMSRSFQSIPRHSVNSIELQFGFPSKGTTKTWRSNVMSGEWPLPPGVTHREGRKTAEKWTDSEKEQFDAAITELGWPGEYTDDGGWKGTTNQQGAWQGIFDRMPSRNASQVRSYANHLRTNRKKAFDRLLQRHREYEAGGADAVVTLTAEGAEAATEAAAAAAAAENEKAKKGEEWNPVEKEQFDAAITELGWPGEYTDDGEWKGVTKRRGVWKGIVDRIPSRDSAQVKSYANKLRTRNKKAFKRLLQRHREYEAGGADAEADGADAVATLAAKGAEAAAGEKGAEGGGGDLVSGGASDKRDDSSSKKKKKKKRKKKSASSPKPSGPANNSAKTGNAVDRSKQRKKRKAVEEVTCFLSYEEKRAKVRRGEPVCQHKWAEQQLLSELYDNPTATPGNVSSKTRLITDQVALIQRKTLDLEREVVTLRSKAKKSGEEETKLAELTVKVARYREALAKQQRKLEELHAKNDALTQKSDEAQASNGTSNAGSSATSKGSSAPADNASSLSDESQESNSATNTGSSAFSATAGAPDSSLELSNETQASNEKDVALNEGMNLADEFDMNAIPGGSFVTMIWSLEEDETIGSMAQQGNNCSIIAAALGTGRTSSEIKNRWKWLFLRGLVEGDAPRLGPPVREDRAAAGAPGEPPGDPAPAPVDGSAALAQQGQGEGVHRVGGRVRGTSGTEGKEDESSEEMGDDGSLTNGGDSGDIEFEDPMNVDGGSSESLTANPPRVEANGGSSLGNASLGPSLASIGGMAIAGVVSVAKGLASFGGGIFGGSASNLSDWAIHLPRDEGEDLYYYNLLNTDQTLAIGSTPPGHELVAFRFCNDSGGGSQWDVLLGDVANVNKLPVLRRALRTTWSDVPPFNFVYDGFCTNEKNEGMITADRARLEGSGGIGNPFVLRIRFQTE